MKDLQRQSMGGVTPIDPVLPPVTVTGVKTLLKWPRSKTKGQGEFQLVKMVKIGPRSTSGGCGLISFEPNDSKVRTYSQANTMAHRTTLVRVLEGGIVIVVDTLT